LYLTRFYRDPAGGVAQFSEATSYDTTVADPVDLVRGLAG
jgi:hypothetical protein